jgi:hypothetical protein
LFELFLIFVCLWLSTKIRNRLSENGGQNDAWGFGKQALRWGALIVTVPLLAYFGITRFIRGEASLSLFAVLLGTGLAGVVLMGIGIEITGNVITDAILISISLVIVSFIILSGIPEALARISGENLCRWMLLCVVAAIIIRAFTWALKGK